MKKQPYLDMVGKYIRMERPASADEQALGDPPTIGMECVVDKVEFRSDGSATVIADYGYAFTVTPDMEDRWTFTVWPDEAMARREQGS